MHSDEAAAVQPTDAVAPDETAASTSVTARFFGGPLDGRVTTVSGEQLATGHVTHVYLHAGPKIETRYRLMAGADGGWEYRVIG